jgi:UDP-glucuronate 4-epimerase
VPVTFADITSARQKLGYQPKVSMEEGLHQFAEWYKQYFNI